MVGGEGPCINRIWYATIGAGSKCGGESYAHITWSDDDGKTWQNPTDDTCRQLQGGMSVVEGPAPACGAKPVGYPHVVYHCGNVQDAVSPLSTHCWKSLDGGDTWTYVEGPNNAPNCDNERPRGRAVGPDGTFYMSIECAGKLEIATSHDEGASWQVQPLAATEGTAINRVDVSSITTDKAGNVYIAWIAGGAGGSRALGQPYMLISHTKGTTWGPREMVAAPGVDAVEEVGVTADRPGHVAISYLGSPDGGQTFNGYLTESWNAQHADPTFWSAAVNDPQQPLMVGPTGTSAVHGDRLWFVTVAFGPDGSAWTAFHCAHTTACPLRDGVAGRLVGRPAMGRGASQQQPGRIAKTG